VNDRGLQPEQMSADIIDGHRRFHAKLEVVPVGRSLDLTPDRRALIFESASTEIIAIDRKEQNAVLGPKVVPGCRRIAIWSDRAQSDWSSVWLALHLVAYRASVTGVRQSSELLGLHCRRFTAGSS
jgi:hypothetical protein